MTANLILSAILIIAGVGTIVGAARMARGTSGKKRGIAMLIGAAVFVWGLISTNTSLRDGTPAVMLTVLASVFFGACVGFFIGHESEKHVRG